MVAIPADVFGQNSYVVLRSVSGPCEVKLIGTTRDRQPTDVAPMPGYGESVADDLRPGVTEILVDLEESLARRVVLSDDEDVFMLADLSIPRKGQRGSRCASLRIAAGLLSADD